ncbi:hypothetical protein CKO28_24365 [Rhodovibrio sodomensis]|uniref:histidine kinase n=1 Tax=Rhodovibrio sodomensis TaxID=1088 RepID=A0ABS1DLZ9_9PROT|nr:GAF domain-containing sensor histidine kinase [Rhodovibrio sodomensis]MBK1671143.1 hypothetical protein [Rhodovibrio sodomensis]
MPPAPKPSNEHARLQAVRAHFAGGEAHDDGLQEVAEAAAEILGVPIALVSIVDAEHQFFSGNHGLTGCQTTPRDVAFCGYTILGDELLEVPDATIDSRFRDNPLVIGTPYIRFYAGVLLVTDEGARIGTLCLIDTEPRRLSATDKKNLHVLARTAARILSKIRERLRIQHELEDALAIARQAEATKGAFLASMSHELRTPLNAVIGFAQVLESEAFGSMPDRRYVDYAQDIHASGTHLLELINDILDLSCLEAGRRQFYPDELKTDAEVEWVRRMIAPIAKKHRATVQVDLSQAPERIVWDRLGLRQILLNLVSNAVKYGRSICSIEVRRLAERDLQIAIVDDGPGVDPAVQARLFEPFARLANTISRETEGTGLGLALCRSLVELGGGRIYMDSEPGKGTRIVVLLKRAVPVDMETRHGDAQATADGC